MGARGGGGGAGAARTFASLQYTSHSQRSNSWMTREHPSGQPDGTSVQAGLAGGLPLWPAIARRCQPLQGGVKAWHACYCRYPPNFTIIEPSGKRHLERGWARRWRRPAAECQLSQCMQCGLIATLSLTGASCIGLACNLPAPASVSVAATGVGSPAP